MLLSTNWEMLTRPSFPSLSFLLPTKTPLLIDWVFFFFPRRRGEKITHCCQTADRQKVWPTGNVLPPAPQQFSIFYLVSPFPSPSFPHFWPKPTEQKIELNNLFIPLHFTHTDKARHPLLLKCCRTFSTQQLLKPQLKISESPMRMRKYKKAKKCWCGCSTAVCVWLLISNAQHDR